jgi:hypothetical protein
VPGFEDILGDKLTAFAPNTIGIPYEKNGDSRAMEIIKQLYDIGSLLIYADDTSIVAETFRIFAQTELGYRKCDPDIIPVLEDIYTWKIRFMPMNNPFNHLGCQVTDQNTKKAQVPQPLCGIHAPLQEYFFKLF